PLLHSFPTRRSSDLVTESDVSRSLAARAHMDWIDLSSIVIPPEIIKQIRAEDARRFKVIPVAFGETGLIVAVSDPLDIDTIDSLDRKSTRLNSSHVS